MRGGGEGIAVHTLYPEGSKPRLPKIGNPIKHSAVNVKWTAISALSDYRGPGWRSELGIGGFNKVRQRYAETLTIIFFMFV